MGQTPPASAPTLGQNDSDGVQPAVNPNTLRAPESIKIATSDFMSRMMGGSAGRCQDRSRLAPTCGFSRPFWLIQGPVFREKAGPRVDATGSALYPESLVHRPWLSLFLGLFALSLPVASSAANTKGFRRRAVVPSGPPPAIMPLSDVKPGMVGQALTVFQGTKPEPFKVRVVSVMHNFLPKQDVILIRAEDPRVEFSGIVAGMSGSPVYIDGKLMGAIAYAWSFSKEPLGGVTPIETMLSERSRPRRVREETMAFASNGATPAPADGAAGAARAE